MRSYLKFWLVMLVAGVSGGGVLRVSAAFGQDYAPTRLQERSQYLKPQKVVILSAAADGIITNIAYTPQDFVHQGQTLIQLDDDLVKLQIESLKVKIALNEEIDTKDAAIRYQFAQDNLDIVQQMYNEKIGESRVVSEKELKEAIQTEEIAELGPPKTTLTKKLLEIELQQNQKLLDRHAIKASDDGVLVRFDSVTNLEDSKLKEPQVGEMVKAGQPLAALMKIDRLSVTVPKDAGELDDVRLGQKAVVHVDNGRGQVEAVSGEVVFISPTVVGAVQRFHIEVEIDNPTLNGQDQPRGVYRYRFRPGMKVTRIELVEDNTAPSRS